MPYARLKEDNGELLLLLPPPRTIMGVRVHHEVLVVVIALELISRGHKIMPANQLSIRGGGRGGGGGESTIKFVLPQNMIYPKNAPNTHASRHRHYGAFLIFFCLGLFLAATATLIQSLVKKVTQKPSLLIRVPTPLFRGVRSPTHFRPETGYGSDIRPCCLPFSLSHH